MRSIRDRLIVALDVADLEEAKPLIDRLAPHVGMFKVGLELTTAVGVPAAVEAVRSRGGSVMLDGKFSDIPNTVEGAAKAAAGHGVSMFTVHASCGRKSVRKAAEAARSSIVAGVTVLTSIDSDECEEIFGGKPAEKVAAFANMLVDAKAGAVVCSPREAALLRGLPLLLVTPGIRPSWAETGDQARVTTPAEAVRAGADMLVIGRPITRPPRAIGSPEDAARRILDEIAEAVP